MCNMDCFNCREADCVNDTLTEAEREAQNRCDRKIVKERKYGESLNRWKYDKSLKGRARIRRYFKSAKGKVAQKKYARSEKGKEAAKRYAQSDKGKATQKRYMQSEKGKAAARRKNQKQIASGKNAEYCRVYYQKQKEKLMRGA